MSTEPLIIELSGDFPTNFVQEVEASVDLGDDFEIALGKGMNAERSLKIIADTGSKALDIVKKVLALVYQADRVTGVKITKNSVEIGSMRAQDTTKVKKLIGEVLEKID